MKKQSSALMAVVAIGAVYLILGLAGVGCPIRAWFGISCAGCGMTRAWQQALQGNWLGAFCCHPLFWTVPLVGLVYGVRRQLRKPVQKWLCRILVGAFLGVYFVRLLQPTDTIVVWQPQTGLLWQWAIWFFGMIGGWIHVL